MAIRDSALNIVIRAKDLTGRAVSRLRTQLTATDQAAQGAGASLARMAKAAAGLASAALGIGALTRASQSMLRTGDEFERLQITMESLMGSLQGGQQATAWIKQFAQDTPHQVTEVTDAFIKLKGFGIDPMNGSLQAIVDQNAKLGKGQENLTGITLALGQAWAKQKLQGEEILQLVERGVPVWDLLSEATGRTTLELQEMSSAGTLGRDVISKLIEAMGEGASGAAARNMTLLSGYVSNLKDEWANFQDEVAQAGALDFAKDTLRELLDTVQRMKADGSLAALARSWSEGFVTVAGALVNTAKAIAGASAELAFLGRAFVALKLASWANGLRAAAVGFVGIQTGARAAGAAVLSMGKVMRSVAFVALAEGIYRVAAGILEVKAAAEANDQAAANMAATYARINAVATERARTLGLEISSLTEWKTAIRDGVVVLDEQTGAYRLNRAAAEQQGFALTALAAGMSTLKQNAQSLSAPFQALRATFDEARASGESLDEALAAMAGEAATRGVEGIQALALQLRLLEQQGEATREELIEGLGGALAELSAEDRGQFTRDLTAGLEAVSAAGADTTVRLEYMQTLLQANLVAAAQAMGISVNEALSGVDAATGTAVTQLGELSAAMQAAGVEGEEAGRIMAAGFGQVIETLDSQAEVDAFTEELSRMAAEGEISSADLNAALEQVRQKTIEIANAAKESGDALSGAMDEAGAAAEGAAQVGNAAAGIGAAMAGIYEGVHGEIEKLSAGAVQAFENLQGMGQFTTDAPVGEMESLTASIEDANASIARMIDVAIGDVVGVSTWMKNLRINAEETKVAFYQQQIAFDQLMNSWQNGTVTAEQFITQAESAEDTLGLLDQQDLGQLRRAIGQAEQQMARLKATTEDTVAALRTELDQLQGNTEDIERRQYEARKRDLEAALKDAQQTGNDEALQDARESLRLAEDIHKAKLGQIRTEAAERAARDQEADARATSAAQREREQERPPGRERRPAPSPSAPQAPAQAAGSHHTIELKLGGRSSTVTTDNPEALLALLAEAGTRTS